MISQCIYCNSKKINKYGITGKGKKRYKCLICKVSFLEDYARPRLLEIQAPAKVIVITAILKHIRLAYEENIFTETEMNLIIPLLKEMKSSFIKQIGE